MLKISIIIMLLLVFSSVNGAYVYQYCMDNTTLKITKSRNITIDTITKEVTINELELCSNGCENSTLSGKANCKTTTTNYYLMGLGIIVIGLLFIVVVYWILKRLGL